MKLLQLITPTNDYEERVPVKFIKMVQNRLRGAQRSTANESLLMDSSFMYGITFSYTPSQLPLEQVALPENLRCSSLIKAM